MVNVSVGKVELAPVICLVEFFCTLTKMLFPTCGETCFLYTCVQCKTFQIFSHSWKMVKTKKNKKGMAEKMAGKSKTAAKLNPFDVRFVKSKQSVIGRKNKNDIGKPGVARAKAIQKVINLSFLRTFTFALLFV